uniref:Fibronectin type III domain containing 1 n=1 Tax=Nothobranchius furzeri TaxID=105023 RepID=A0A8C6LUU7_NOTFU
FKIYNKANISFSNHQLFVCKNIYLWLAHIRASETTLDLINKRLYITNMLAISTYFVWTIFSVHSVNPGRAWYPFLFVASESVHVVSLQAQKAQGQSAPSNRAVTTKTQIPEPPEYEARDISVRVMSPKSVLISWVDPAVEMGKVDPGTSRSYTVKFREKGESARWEYKESTQRRMMIDTLSADGMYEFSIRISQGEKHSKWSVSVFQRTPESAPSGPPENFEVKPLRGKGTAVTATWDPPEEPNGRIREYILSYAPAMRPFGMKSVTYRGSTTTATIDGLTQGERYIFKIRATNRRGMGPQSKAFSVAMPQANRATSSFSKSKDTQRTTHPSSKQDTDNPNFQSKEKPEEPTTTPKSHHASNASRRARPLSQTRSYHSIFSSVRGSVRNGVNRVSTRPRAKEDEEQEHDKVPTTPPPAEETTTMEVVPEPEQLDNDVSLLSEDEVDFIKEPLSTETPSLKVFTPSPTKPVLQSPKRPNRRPVKIRVHQKAGSKDTSSSSSSSPSTTSSFSSSHTQDVSVSRKDHVDITYPETRNIYNKSNTTLVKSSSTGQKDISSHKTGATPVGTSSSSAESSSSSGSKYGFGRRQPGILFRGNFTRLLNGHKPTVNTQFKPIRTQSQVTLNTLSSAKSQSTLPERTQHHETSDGLDPTRSPSRSSLDSHATSDSNDSDQSLPGSHGTKTSHASLDGRASFREGNGDMIYKHVEHTEPKHEEQILNSKDHVKEEDEDKRKVETTNRKTISSRTRISSSFAEKFPWLASRYPGKFITFLSIQVIDLERGILMNQDGKVLQDSQGKPKRVVLGEDGRTIFDHMGSPLVSQEGIALFGHGRDSQPVINPKDKFLTVGGKPVLGLDLLRPRTSVVTTTKAPTTTVEPTTIEWTTEEFTTGLPYPTCPSGTFSKTDEYGYPILDPEGILDCYPEEEMFVHTTLLPTTTTTTTTTTSTTTTVPTPEPHNQSPNRGPSSEFDLSGKKRFTAPYVNYIQKDPGAPCSLTEALEFLQVDILGDVIEKDSMALNQNQPPKNKPQNLTVVAMEGCHSFIILDWARPLKDDMVSGYMVHSASYDDVLNNRWSTRASSGTHLPVENLKPNSRYYFKVQAKNVFGLGPFSETLTYVTESGGEPIWIPFTFKYNPIHSSCKGSQYVKRTWYRKFVGVVLCNSLRYKIFMGDGLREPFYSIGDSLGQGEDHCQFVDSYRDGRTGPVDFSNNLPSAQGYYRAYRQEPVTFGVVGRRTAYPFVGWYECGVPIPGKW